MDRLSGFVQGSAVMEDADEIDEGKKKRKDKK